MPQLVFACPSMFAVELWRGSLVVIGWYGELSTTGLVMVDNCSALWWQGF